MLFSHNCIVGYENVTPSGFAARSLLNDCIEKPDMLKTASDDTDCTLASPASQRLGDKLKFAIVKEPLTFVQRLLANAAKEVGDVIVKGPLQVMLGDEGTLQVGQTSVTGRTKES